MNLGKLAKFFVAVGLSGAVLAAQACKSESNAPAAKTPEAMAPQGSAPPADTVATTPGAGPQPTDATASAKTADGARIIEMAVTENGYEPTPIRVKKGEPLVLRITRKTDKTCATEIVIKDTNINTKLPLNETVDVAWTPEKSGQIKFGCAMGMMISGVFDVAET